MAREDLHFRLRIPEDLKRRIESAAELNMRSMTAEIIERVRYTFGPVDEEMLALVETISTRDLEIAELTRQQASLSAELDALRKNYEMQNELLSLHEESSKLAQLVCDRSEVLAQRQATLASHLANIVMSLDSPPTEKDVAFAKEALRVSEELKLPRTERKSAKKMTGDQGDVGS